MEVGEKKMATGRVETGTSRGGLGTGKESRERKWEMRGWKPGDVGHKMENSGMETRKEKGCD